MCWVYVYLGKFREVFYILREEGRRGRSVLFFSGFNIGINFREIDILKLKLIIIRFFYINNIKYLFSIFVNCELGNMCRVKL